MISQDSDPGYVIASGAVFLFLCPIAVGLRFYTRRIARTFFGVDDWLLIPALILLIGCAVTTIYGVSQHVYGYDSPSPDSPDYMRLFRINEQLYLSFYLMQIPLMGLIKLSFLFFFRRIFVVPNSMALNRISLGMVGIIILWTAGFFIYFFCSCGGHFTYRWRSPADFREYCPNDFTCLMGFVISDFLTDIVVLALPFFPIMKLQTTKSRKVAIFFVFALGLAALVASTIRLVFMQEIIRESLGEIAQSQHSDLLATRAVFWSMLQSGLALIACCLPTFRAIANTKPMQSLLSGVRKMYSYASSGSSRPRKSSSGVDSEAQRIADVPMDGFAGSKCQTSTTISAVGKAI